MSNYWNIPGIPKGFCLMNEIDVKENARMKTIQIMKPI